MTPNWTAILQTIALLSVLGFGLVILSGFWHLQLLLTFTAVLLWIWKASRRTSR